MSQQSCPIIIAQPDAAAARSSDCDCACAATPLPHPGELWDVHTPLVRAAGQRELALDDEFAVAFVPSASRVAVLNRAAQRLLARFATPTRPDALTPENRTPARQLAALGLIGCVGRAPAPPPPPAELSAWLHVTNACNLRCTYCYVEKTDETMADETGFAAADMILRTARRHGYRAIYLKYAGGEASLNLPLVEQIHAYMTAQAAPLGIGVAGVVLSNGVGLTTHKLRRIHSLGLRLMISLDGPRAYHDAQRPRAGGQGSFDAACASVERAQALGLDLTVSITITGASAQGVAELVAWLLARRVHFSLNFYRECDASARRDELQIQEQRIIEAMEAAYRAIARDLPAYSLLGCLLDRANLAAPHQQPCAAGRDYLVIGHRGDVAACQMEISRPVTTIWDNDPLLAIRLDAVGLQNPPVEEKAGCRDCAWRLWCAGGCPLATFRATGRYDVRSPNCAIYQALYPQVIRLEGLRLLKYASAA